MPKPARQKVHQVWWDLDAWDEIEAAAEYLAERDHRRTTVTDVIRAGTLGLVKDLRNERESVAEAS